MRYFTLLLTLVFTLGVSDMSLAKKKRKKRSKKRSMVEPWGMAGCGLGSQVFKSNTKGAQIGAWFLNGLTLASSSVSSSKGSSGCDKGPDLRAAYGMESEVYLDVNYAQIKKDAAQGGGKHLMAFYGILGCDEGAQAKLASEAQRQYSQIFENKSSNEALKELHSRVQLEYADYCPNITAS